MTALANNFIFWSRILLGIAIFGQLYWKRRITFNKKA